MRARPILITAALAALALPGAAHAASPWSSAETVSRSPGDRPAAAVGPSGIALLAWTGPGRAARLGAYGARRSAARGFGTPFAFRTQDRGLDGGAVQFDAAGNALVAYRRLLQRNHRIESPSVRRTGSRTSPISLSGPGSSAYAPTFAEPPAGTFAAAPVLTWWRRETDRVQLARAAGGRLPASVNDTVPGATDASYAQLSDGTLLAAGARRTSIAVARRGATGAFAATTLASGRGPFRDPSVAAGRGSAAAVAWREFLDGTYRVRLAVRPDGGSFGAPLTISPAGDMAAAPRVLITATGAIRVAYVSALAPTSARGPLRLAAPDGTQTLLTAPGEQVREHRVGTDGAGEITAAWTRFRQGHSGGTVMARTVGAGGVPGRARRLGDAREEGSLLTLAVAPRGDAVAAWVTRRAIRAIYRPRL